MENDLFQMILKAVISGCAISTIINVLANNYFQKKQFNQEFQKLRKQYQEEISKALVLRSHEIYLKFAKAWGDKFINQTPDKQGVVLSEDDKNEIMQILFEIMYGSHDFNIKKSAYESIQELKGTNSTFNNLELLNRELIDAPMKDCNLITSPPPKNCIIEWACQQFSRIRGKVRK